MVPAVINRARVSEHEAGGIDTFQGEKALLVAPHHVVAVDVHRAPEIHLGYIGRPWVPRVERIDHLEPPQIDRAVKWKGSRGRFDVTAKTVERHQDDIGITLAK